MLTTVGRDIELRRCATLIQTTWRGFRERRKYKVYRSNHIPTQFILRQKYCIDKIAECNDILASEISVSTANLASLFETLDLSRIEYSDPDHEYLDPEQQVTIEDSRIFLADEDSDIDDNVLNPLHFPMPKKPKINWQNIFQTAKTRSDICPICIQKISFPSSIKAAENQNIKSLLLLDCSHVYHEACLNCFQRSGRSDCPVCRREYISKRICL